jgi:hypothetical protein
VLLDKKRDFFLGFPEKITGKEKLLFFDLLLCLSRAPQID